ncbi:uncharacterized protein ARMOST_02038 [Armillaria ostoyae]|uniref:Uncharacterized protein n=1 Tax=Armillaria ostoyae TaxID=47428 RepID=A0A284QQL3_ARMOS|nr:uncharacterized protein ARMOST_02038 [Armillaria ostoyae]
MSTATLTGGTLSHNMYLHPLLRLSSWQQKFDRNSRIGVCGIPLVATAGRQHAAQFGDYPMEYKSFRRLIMGLPSYQYMATLDQSGRFARPWAPNVDVKLQRSAECCVAFIFHPNTLYALS